jgi:hypothetical protein
MGNSVSITETYSISVTQLCRFYFLSVRRSFQSRLEVNLFVEDDLKNDKQTKEMLEMETNIVKGGSDYKLKSETEWNLE